MIQNIETYRPKLGERILVDANVLVFLFCPLGNYSPKKIRTYETFMNKAKKGGNELIATSLILSEFVNVWLRLEFADFKKANPAATDFKRDFRSTPWYEGSISDIETVMNHQVLSYVLPVDDAFEAIGPEACFKSGLDYNDGHTVALAQNQGCSILTDDGDFGAVGSVVNVITWNRGLLGV